MAVGAKRFKLPDCGPANALHDVAAVRMRRDRLALVTSIRQQPQQPATAPAVDSDGWQWYSFLLAVSQNTLQETTEVELLPWLVGLVEIDGHGVEVLKVLAGVNRHASDL